MFNMDSIYPINKALRLTCILPLALLVGCAESNYETAPVSGTVMVKGKPAANVFVQFEPAQKESDDVPSSTAITDTQGKFSLKVSVPDGEQGAVIGEHVIRFAPAGDKASEATEGPQSYSRPSVRLSAEATSGKMRYTVPEGGDTNANFELK